MDRRKGRRRLMIVKTKGRNIYKRNTSMLYKTKASIHKPPRTVVPDANNSKEASKFTEPKSKWKFLESATSQDSRKTSTERKTLIGEPPVTA